MRLVTLLEVEGKAGDALSVGTPKHQQQKLERVSKCRNDDPADDGRNDSSVSKLNCYRIS